jgi:dTDP-4-dehydrorhamnose 3,5-epimerase|tara:strand:- start:45 stop:584 length:540 start_codon:yes stop_codon:yes gene_type:complete
MKVIYTKLADCVIIEPEAFGDERGFFLETFHEQRYKDMAGIREHFVQDNYSRSSKGVLRGLHFQINKPQGKLVRVVRGSVFDVSVDIRPSSKTFGEWVSVELNEENKKQIWIPPGFAHGFIVLSDMADFEYKCTNLYDPSDEGIIHYQDPDLSIDWPAHLDIKISEKDKAAPSFHSIFK